MVYDSSSLRVASVLRSSKSDRLVIFGFCSKAHSVALVNQDYWEEFLAVWFQTIVGQDFKTQAECTSLLLNHAGPDNRIFLHSPFEQDPDSEAFEVGERDLKQKRLQLLDGALRCPITQQCTRR